GDALIALGSPIIIKEQTHTLGTLNIDDSNVVVISGGLSSAYKKFGPEYIGAVAVEIFKGTFDTGIKNPESSRVYSKLVKDYPTSRITSMWIECNSSNTYENISESYDVLKYLGMLRKNIVLAGTIEQLPRAIETLRTVAKKDRPDINIKGLPYNPKIAETWHKSLWWRSRFAAEIERLRHYSCDESAENRIELSELTRAKLQKLLELSR
ncbi:MAG: hypothetical protein LBD94_03470, partial [Rickettsiales bacterium]|nr:hypothetical protein [Rickettsiales bacterium]